MAVSSLVALTVAVTFLNSRASTNRLTLGALILVILFGGSVRVRNREIYDWG